MSPHDHSEASAQTLNGAEVLLRILEEEGVDVIFGYPGGAVLPIYDALFKQNTIRHILVRHEQAAVHAAEAYARSTGKVGVVLVTSGPGGTNTVTGLMDAKMDSVPVVCLSGQVPVPLLGKDAFQEADIVAITAPITKKSTIVKTPDSLASIVRDAFKTARSGRPGPVLVDLPKNITTSPAPLPPISAKQPAEAPQKTISSKSISDAIAALETARRPLFYIGGGLVNAGDEAVSLFRELAAKTGFPVTSTLMALGAFPASHAQSLGMIGMHGAVEANMAAHECDVLIALGARFDDRVTGRVDAFSPHSFKIQADIDPREFGKIIPVNVTLEGDLTETLRLLLQSWGDRSAPDLKTWWDKIENWRDVKGFSFEQSHEPHAAIKPQYAIRRLHQLSQERGKETYVTTEVGQHQMWAAQHFGFEKPAHWLTSGGLGTMGYGLPATVGVQIAHPDALVIDIAGEASTLMNIQELGTIVQYRLPVKIFILNNHYMGMVRQWQELLHGSRYSQSYSESLPDFVRLAESFGLKGLRARHVGELDKVITEMLAYDGPVLADICVAEEENCYPMIPSGAAHNQMLLGPDRVYGGAELTEEGKHLV
ncbi:biosynthetic-type acetolactate synthase large subunit [Aristophania vespae]|uniref:biosynthetic-type acetolactate synthase large subunit n=1 Tax=Aristophania vespae TaxID=2697033 RepID=UPI0023512566|nr:biosynthetic-type acetolactate synthase large subunit [Aristophania vespae]UMM64076.1 Acetolactate synthase isozyme 3 large subunit [Aristophania vespae]